MEIVRGDGELLKRIDLTPKNAHQEVLQNIAVILSTVQNSCPMLRGLGVPGDLIGRPINVAENLLVATLYDQIEEYEPRAIIEGITFERDDLRGILIPIIKLEGVRDVE